MGSWWSGSAPGQASCKTSGSSPSDGVVKPDGITKVSSGVYELCEPVGALEVEIVFIHGLQLFDYLEAYWKTWMGGTDGKECWPMTWLAKDFPGARIWSLSYDSSAWRTATRGNMDGYVVGETLVQELVENARIGQHGVPVLFVCHSLGGLVAKEIVGFAHTTFGKREKYVKFLQSIRGFLYYSTPHDGSFLADYVKYVPNKGKMVAKLEVINDGIGRLNFAFERIEKESYHEQWKHSAVGEGHLTPVPYTNFSIQVVKDASARHGYPYITAPADHFGVCKPTEKTSVSYLKLVNLIEDVGIARNRTQMLSNQVTMNEELM